MALKPESSNRPKWSSNDPWSPAIEHTPGAYPPSPAPEIVQIGEHKTVTAAVKARKDEYVRKKTIKLKVGTWNVAALSDTYKDLGGWFADGLGIKGTTQALSGLNIDDGDSAYDSDYEVESVEEQEARKRKKSSTLPRNDTPGVAHGDEIDLYVLGLQEVIDVSSVTEAMRPYTDPNPARRWKSAVRKHLPKGYRKVVEHQLIGLLLLVFAAPDLASEVSSVDSTSVGTGLMGYLGNKGAVSARILLGESTRLLFVNCHLAAGADAQALTRRIWDAQQILSRTRFAAVGNEWVGGDGQAEGIGDEDFAFWFGDLNYRLDDIPGEDVRRLLLLHARNEYDILNASKRKIDSELGYLSANGNGDGDGDGNPTNNPYESREAERLAEESSRGPELDPENDPASLHTTLKSLFIHDQLKAQQKAKKAFHEGWKEGEINFLPTYKYDVGSVAMFDSGEKKRSPSWCDRILFRTRVDYEHYQQQTKKDAEAAVRDAEMKKNGLDDAASEEDVLFDYDPDADEYDEVEQHDCEGDLNLVRTRDGPENALVLEKYVSHQRVLSSDHKPLSAVFSLIYDSVDHELKARVHEQVVREFDRAENEARPTITMVFENNASKSVADKSSDSTDMKIDFGQVRYRVLCDQNVTIANTGQIQVIFSFIDRPSSEQGTTGPFPSWLNVQIHSTPDTSKNGPPDLGSSERFKLAPGETITVDISVDVSEASMVKMLNSGDLALDDVLVLRVSNGRDYFIPVKGWWQQTCFCRTIDELVRVPSGVRSLTKSADGVEAQNRPANAIVHSAPQELFVLSDAIPHLAERVAADWTMLHEAEQPPWQKTEGVPWPFGDELDTDSFVRDERLAEIREALDKAESIDQHLSPRADPAEKLSLLCQTLTEFLDSLTDGIVTTDVWSAIDTKLLAAEKAKNDLSLEQIQEISMEAVSTTPVHSVTLTFITFMLGRLIQETSLDIGESNEMIKSPTNRGRSSTSASAMSDVSLSSIKSNNSTYSKRAFFPGLRKRGTGFSTISTPLSPTSPQDLLATEESSIAGKYAEFFAPLVIRSDQSKMKDKEKRSQLARKVRVLESFLQTV